MAIPATVERSDSDTSSESNHSTERELSSSSTATIRHNRVRVKARFSKHGPSQARHCLLIERNRESRELEKSVPVAHNNLVSACESKLNCEYWSRTPTSIESDGSFTYAAGSKPKHSNASNVASGRYPRRICGRGNTQLRNGCSYEDAESSVSEWLGGYDGDIESGNDRKGSIIVGGVAQRRMAGPLRDKRRLLRFRMSIRSRPD